MNHRALAPVLLIASSALSLEACKGCKSDSNIVTDRPAAQSTDDQPYDHDWGSWLSMDALSDGSPVVSYYDKTQGGAGFAVATLDESGLAEWSHEEVDGYPNEEGLDVGDRGKYTSLRVAPDDTVWVAYQDVTNHSLRFGTRDPSTGEWTNNIADAGGGASPDAGQFASLALDASSEPVIAHYDAGEGDLRIAHYYASTGLFQGEIVDAGEAPPADTGGETVEADVGRFASLEIVDGVEYIAYYDAANGDLKLAWGPSGDYTIETIDSEGDVGQWPDLMIADGTIHIAYQDAGDQHLKYANGEPGAWTVETVDSSPYVGADAAIFRDGTYLSILYFDGKNNDMRRAWRADGAWQTELVTGEGIARGFHNEVISTGGTTYAACYDYTNKTIWFSAL